jgi:hypothetical protein
MDVFVFSVFVLPRVDEGWPVFQAVLSSVYSTNTFWNTENGVLTQISLQRQAVMRQFETRRTDANGMLCWISLHKAVEKS